MTTFVRGELATRRRVASTPSMPGMIRSIKGHVGGVLRGEPHGLLPAPGLGDHADVALRLQEGPHPLAHQRVIVHQQHRDRLAHNSLPFSCRNGQKPSTRVPLPGALSTLTCPPSLTSRSRML